MNHPRLAVAVVVGFLATSISFFDQAVAAQSPPPPPAGASLEDIAKQFPPADRIERVAENLYVIPGQGGNTAVWVYSKGVVLVDTKFPTNGAKLLGLIRTVTDKPLTHVINTHAHGDHNGSNIEFAVPLTIVAQENTKKRMLTMKRFTSDEGKAGLPTVTFEDKLTLFEGKDAIDLYYFGRAHTDGDALVVFRSARAMHAGDIFKHKELPTFDAGAGGSGVEFSSTLAHAAKRIHNVDRIITGHDDQILLWKDFVDYAQLSKLFLKHERAEFKAGKTPEETLAEFKLDERFQGFTLKPSSFGGVDAVRRTFEELGK